MACERNSRLATQPIQVARNAQACIALTRSPYTYSSWYARCFKKCQRLQPHADVAEYLQLERNSFLPLLAAVAVHVAGYIDHPSIVSEGNSVIQQPCQQVLSVRSCVRTLLVAARLQHTAHCLQCLTATLINSSKKSYQAHSKPVVIHVYDVIALKKAFYRIVDQDVKLLVVLTNSFSKGAHTLKAAQVQMHHLTRCDTVCRKLRINKSVHIHECTSL
eukprot:15221-Heterococcus_DN1.PRE.2